MLHLSATAFGGGVAEINYTLIPLMRDAGLDVEWRIIRGQDEFFDVTKRIHNALQGRPDGLTPEQERIFHEYNRMNAEEWDDSYDFVIVHDPQPAAMIEYVGESRARWIWRCHIDLSTPYRPVIDFLAPRAQALRRGHLPHAGLRAGDRRPAARVHLAAGDRPAEPEEHGAVRRRTPRTSSTSSGSTSTGRSSRRSRASTPGRTRSA